MYLQTLKEIILNKPSSLAQNLKELVSLYLDQSKSQNVSIKSTISESIGTLFRADPQNLSNTGIFKAAFTSGDNNTIATFARSFKFSAFKNTNETSFVAHIDILVAATQNKDCDVKTYSYQAINQIIQNPNLKTLLTKHANTLISQIKDDVVIKPELIDEIDLGAFKNKNDRGAPVRKEAFAVLETIVENFPNIDQSTVVDSTIFGLKDTFDNIQNQCLNLMGQLFKVCNSIVISKMDSLTGGFDHIYKKNKNNLSKEKEAEKSLTLMRGVFRLCRTINNIEEAKSNVAFDNWFQTTILGVEDLKVMYESQK